MPANFVALDIALPAPGRRGDHARCEIAAVVDESDRLVRLLFLEGADDLTTRARGYGERGVEVVAATDLSAVCRQLLEYGEGTPWVTFDQASRLEAWADQDTTGALATVPAADAGDLAALAMPWVAGRSVEGFLAAALAFTDPAAPAPEPAHGLPFAEAVAALWRLLPLVIAQRPYAVREEIAVLLERSGHALGDIWRAAAGRIAPVDKEPRTLDALLRARLRELTPDAPRGEEEPAVRPVDVATVSAVFDPDGPLARLVERWERREGQTRMAELVAEAFNEGQCLLVEAGTGTGKSLAYLAPAVLFAVQNGVKVVVSTATKNLQDQLCAKDLPLLAEALDVDFRAEQIKGRGNYLCVEKLLRESGELGLLPGDDQVFLLAYLLSWAAVTASGDLDELSAYLLTRYPRLQGYAQRLASDGESCTALSARAHPCFATVARRRAFAADVLVVNHALALANTAVEVLPPFGHIVFDEAHQLEDIATDAFGLSLERRTLLGLAREAGASRDSRSLAMRLKRAVENLEGGEGEAAAVDVTALEPAAVAVVNATEDLGERLGGLVMQRLRRTVDEMTQTERLRIDPSLWSGALGESGKLAAENLRLAAADLVKSLTNLCTRLSAWRGAGAFGSAASGDELERLDTAVQAACGHWTEQLQAIDAMIGLDDPKFVYWLESVLRKDSWEWRLRAAPIEAGAELASRVYARMEAVVLTSATLRVADSFDYFRARLGLDQPDIVERYKAQGFESPFNYREQVLLGLPTNIAEPNDKDFDQNVARVIRDLAELLDGRTLALFTSVRSMKNVYERIAARLEESGIEVLCQGVSGGRHVLAERFRTHQRAILLGTRSFWEGIDVPGEALSAVVIVRLPFAVPTDPVIEARCEALERQGVNAWSRYAVPQAVILFKQGFGRLVRSATDRGVVICLDRRLEDKSYGARFLASVPGYTKVFDRWGEVRERVREWLADTRRRSVE
jgi:predicted DnaQ family exonuclease/DinG family helicase